MQAISDVINFIETLSFVDVVFFFAVLALMMLVITLIYFIKENSDDKIEEPIIVSEPIVENSNSPITELKAITEALESAEPSAINLNNYA